MNHVFVDFKNGQKIDLIGSASGIRITSDLLRCMNAYWFIESNQRNL